MSWDGGREIQSWIERCSEHYDRTHDSVTFNDLIGAAMRENNFEKVDDFFLESTELILWGIKPDASSLDVVIQHCVGLGDLIRAEKYANMARHNFRPSLESYVVLIQAYIDDLEARRAHSWLEWIVKNGFGIYSNCSAQFVCRERDNTVAGFDIRCLLDVVCRVAEALATAGNAKTAGRWLSYLTECGLQPADAPQTWEIVRASHPPDIIPAALWCESRRYPRSWRQKKTPLTLIAGQEPVPPATRSIKLSGEACSPHEPQYMLSPRRQKYTVNMPKPSGRRASWRVDKGARIFDEATITAEIRSTSKQEGMETDVSLPSEYVNNMNQCALNKVDDTSVRPYSSASTWTGCSSPSPPPTRPTSSTSNY